MSLKLVVQEQNVAIKLPVEPQIIGALIEQCERGDQIKLDRLARRMAKELDSVIRMYIDWDLRPPTQSQIQYAIAIARTKGIEIPAEVLRQRRAMGNFLDEHAKKDP